MKNQLYLFYTFLFIIINVFFTVTIPHVQAQQIWGTMNNRGPSGGGVIYSMDLDGSNYEIHHAFPDDSFADGRAPYGRLVPDLDTLFLYGTTRDGGEFGRGTVFKFNLEEKTYHVIKHFEEEEGGGPTASMVRTDDNLFFGVIRGGSDMGALFRIDPTTDDFQIIRRFSDTEFFPTQGFTDGKDGFLYALSPEGGNFRLGSIFRVSTDGQTSGIIKHFNFENSRPPEGTLELGSDGYFYGTTDERALIFKVNRDGEDYQEIKRFEFADSDLLSLSREIFEASDGFMYGFITGENDRIFKIDKDGEGFSEIYEFVSGPGALPLGKLTEDDHGYLYGPTLFSPDGSGLIYKIQKDGTEFQPIYLSTQDQGSRPNDVIILPSLCPLPAAPALSASQLLLDSELTAHVPLPEDHNWTSAIWHWGDGETSEATLTDTTAVGRHTYQEIGDYTVTLVVTDECGTRTSPASETLAVVLTIPPTNGQDTFWGTVVGGIALEGGIIFSINADGSNYQIRKTFSLPSSEEGSNPSNLIQGNDAFFYGTTQDGGNFDQGTIFKIGPDGSGFEVIKHMEDSPVEKLLIDEENYLFGITANSIFSMLSSGEDFGDLRTFSEAEGSLTELIRGSDNVLFGIIGNTIFQISRNGDGYNTVIDLSTTQNGYGAEGNLLLASNGYLYGTAKVTSTPDDYIIFRVNPVGANFELLQYLAYSNQAYYEPRRFLKEGSDGFIYGVLTGFDSNSGELFKMSPDGNELITLHQFDESEWEWPGFPLEGTDGNLYGAGRFIETNHTFLYTIGKDGSGFSKPYSSTSKVDPVGEFILQRLTCEIPSIPSPTLSENQITVGSEVTAIVPISAETEWNTAIWHWGDGDSSVAILTDTTAVGTHVYTIAGSYSVWLEVTDNCGKATSPPSETLEVSDEVKVSSGSVKGVGMFSSPRGAYVAKPQMRGMAHYSIHAKADNGKVSGTFQFKIADLQFRSSKYDQLIIEDNRAWLYGEGKIRGRGKYGFLLAMVDEEDNRNEKSYRKWKTRGKDKLRVKIWDINKDNRIVYDNQLGDSDDAVGVMNIDRGTIIILEEETSPVNELDNEFILDQLKKIKAYPNPTVDRIYVDLGDLSPELITTILTDAYGNMELRDLHQLLENNILEFNVSRLRKGTYYIQVRTEYGYHSVKVLKR